MYQLQILFVLVLILAIVWFEGAGFIEVKGFSKDAALMPPATRLPSERIDCQLPRLAGFAY